MGNARDILDRLAAQRAVEAQEDRRWDAYRRLCAPPPWFMIALGLFGLASMVLLAGALTSAEDRAALDTLGRIGLFFYALLAMPLALYIEKRRRNGLKKILQQEAPELTAKLKAERIL
jgi:hypothetical protein